MHVKVRDALADDVVERHEGALGVERLDHRAGQQPGVGEQRLQQVVGQVGQRLVMLPAGSAGVAGEQGAVVEEGERSLVLEHDVGIGFPPRNRAERAVRVHRPHPIDHPSSIRQDRSGARLTLLRMRILFALTTLTVALVAGSMLSAGASGAGPCTALIRGTSASETLAASAAGTRLLGLEGDDRINGGPGADCIDGGPGNDRIAGLAGGDTLEGADGNDILSGGEGADALAGGPGADRLAGGAGADRLSDVADGYTEAGLAVKRNRLTAGAGRDGSTARTAAGTRSIAALAWTSPSRTGRTRWRGVSESDSGDPRCRRPRRRAAGGIRCSWCASERWRKSRRRASCSRSQ